MDYGNIAMQKPLQNNVSEILKLKNLKPLAHKKLDTTPKTKLIHH